MRSHVSLSWPVPPSEEEVPRPAVAGTGEADVVEISPRIHDANTDLPTPVWEEELDDNTRNALDRVLKALVPIAPKLVTTGDMVELALAIENVLLSIDDSELETARRKAGDYLIRWVMDYMCHVGAPTLKLEIAPGRPGDADS